MFDRFFSKLKGLFSRKEEAPKSYIIRGPDNKYRGEVRAGVYHTERFNMPSIRKQHYFFKFGGYSISLDTLTQLHDGSVPLVHLLEHKDGGGDREFWSALNDWFEEGAPYTNKWGDVQRILPMRYQYESRAFAEARIPKMT